jgi:hypothetical protein
MTNQNDSQVSLRRNSADRTSGRHRTDYVSLIFGLIFLAVVGWWAAAYYLDWEISVHLPDAGWILAGALILLGLIGIGASMRRDRREGELTDGGGPPADRRAPTAPFAAYDCGPDPDQPTAGDPGGHRPE